MNCNDKDLLQYLEGNASKEAEMHIEACGECSKAVRELAIFRKVLPRYREGKKLLDSLDEHMKSWEGQKLSSLPPGIEELLATGTRDESKVRPFRRPEKRETAPGADTEPVILARAAIPRDITKSKKRKDKGEDTKK